MLLVIVSIVAVFSISFALALSHALLSALLRWMGDTGAPTPLAR
jgi:hypothetical protein